MFEVCESVRSKTCLLYCSAGVSTDIPTDLNYHWETVRSPIFFPILQSLSLNNCFLFQNRHCQSEGMSIEISSTVQFPKFTVPADWLNGNFKLKELYIDLENVFVIKENAFAGDVFKSMQKLILINLHLQTMEDTMILRKYVE